MIKQPSYNRARGDICCQNTDLSLINHLGLSGTKKTLAGEIDKKMIVFMLFWIIVTSSKGLIELNISLFKNCLICYQGILRKIIFWIIAGYINIPVEEINGRQFVEKWFTASSGTVGKTGKESKGELPLVRLRLRYQTVHILPKDLYQDFTQVQTGLVVIWCMYIIKAFIHTYYNSASGIDIYGDVNYMYFANLQEKKQLSKY